MYVYVCICIYIYTYMYMYIHMYVYSYVYIYMYMYIYIYIYVLHVYLIFPTRMGMIQATHWDGGHVYAYMDSLIDNTRTYNDVYKYVYICIYMYIYIYVYIYVYIYTYTCMFLTIPAYVRNMCITIQASFHPLGRSPPRCLGKNRQCRGAWALVDHGGPAKPLEHIQFTEAC